jgi:predicted lipoprotein with Yx(FWY)xxD motif
MRIRLLVLTTAFVALVAVGCSSTDSSGTSTNGGGTTAPTTASPGTTAPSAGTSVPTSGTTPSAVATIAIADSPLGKILVDGTGMTIYVFSKDTATSSACTGGCVDAWPAVSGASAEVGDGLDEEDFTTITGSDGAEQIVFYGHPLYTYAGDNGPGETTGQGVGGFWYVVGADGNPVQTAP